MPKDVPRLIEEIRPIDHRVFFGALDLRKLTVPERSFTKLPATKAVLPAGDFRDWAEIDAWAGTIAGVLAERRA